MFNQETVSTQRNCHMGRPWFAGNINFMGNINSNLHWECDIPLLQSPVTKEEMGLMCILGLFVESYRELPQHELRQTEGCKFELKEMNYFEVLNGYETAAIYWG